MKENKLSNKFLQSIYNANKVMSKIESYICIILLWVLITVTMIFISCRFIFHVSTPWADELARYFLIIMAWFGGSYAASAGDHLEIDIVSTVLRKYSKNADKILAVVDRIGQVIVLIVMLFFDYQLFTYIGKVGKLGTVSMTMGFPMTIPMWFVFAGCILITLHTLFNIILPREFWFAHEEATAKKEEEKEGEE